MSRNLQILLVIVGGYLLGFVGAFIITLMDIWDTGPTAYVFSEAAWRSALWPYELVQLFL